MEKRENQVLTYKKNRVIFEFSKIILKKLRKVSTPILKKKSERKMCQKWPFFQKNGVVVKKVGATESSDNWTNTPGRSHISPLEIPHNIGGF